MSDDEPCAPLSTLTAIVSAIVASLWHVYAALSKAARLGQTFLSVLRLSAVHCNLPLLVLECPPPPARPPAPRPPKNRNNIFLEYHLV